MIWCFFCNVSVLSYAQLCHFFLSSRNTISHLTSSHWSAKLHVFDCAGQNDSTSQNLLEIFLFKRSHSSCTKNISVFERRLAVVGYESSVWTSTTKFPIRLTAFCRASAQILAWGRISMIWLQLAYLAPNSSTISIKNALASFDFKLCAEVKIVCNTAKEFTVRKTRLFRKLNETWSSFTNWFVWLNRCLESKNQTANALPYLFKTHSCAIMCVRQSLTFLMCSTPKTGKMGSFDAFFKVRHQLLLLNTNAKK